MLPWKRVHHIAALAQTPLARWLAVAACVAVVPLSIGSQAVGAQALPAGWADQDIGSVGLGGSATYSNGSFTVEGAGADIWGTADSFRFANQLLSQNGQIVARVASMQNTNTYAKAGVMIRETLTAGSRHVVLDLKPDGGVEFMARAATGGTTSFIAGGTGRWLKLVRSNDLFTAYVSGDGVSWTSIGSRSVTMGTSVWVGLAVCSHNTGVLNTAVFDHVAVQAAPAGVDPPPAVSLASPSSGATFAAGTTITIAANATDTDATPVASVEFYANNGSANTLLGADTTSPYTFAWTNVPAGSYSLSAVAVDTAGQAATSSPVPVTVIGSGSGLPAGWADQDIGAVGLGGSASFGNGTFTIQGAGADIWGTADSFNFANQLLPGDGQIVARVASTQNTNAYAKAGVMIRETLTAGSPHVLLDMKPNGGVEFMTRTASGSVTSYVAGGTGNWLKLVRGSGVFTAYVSNDGLAWTAIGSRAVAMAGNVWVGLAVCSHDTGVLNTSLFDHVSVEPSTGGGGGGGGGGADQPPSVVMTSPTGTVYTVGTTIELAATATDTDGTPVAKVEFFANNGTTTTLLATDTTSPYSFSWTDPPTGPYWLTAVATDTANQSATSNQLQIFVRPQLVGTLPWPWVDQDVGTTGLAGSADYGALDGAFTVRGAGADIWGTADSFNFVSKTWSGDGQVFAHLKSMDNTHPYAKAGVMFRETTAAGSRHVLLSVKPDGSVEFMARASTGGATSFIGGGRGDWLKLQRRGNVFTAYVSLDALTWTTVGSTTVSMPSNLLVGAAVCSHNTGVLNTAVFDFLGPAAPSEPAPLISITSPPSGTTFPPGNFIVFQTTFGAPYASSSVHIYADDGTGKRTVDFYILGVSTFLANLPAGSYSVTAEASDGTSSSPIRVNVSTTPAGDVPPTVTGTVGTDGSNTTFTVTGIDPDATPVARIDVFAANALDGTWQLGSSTTSPYTVIWPVDADSMLVIVTDTAGIATAKWF